MPQSLYAGGDNLSLLGATMLALRSANLMDLAAGLPRAAERLDIRDQWISRVLMNPLSDPDAVMAPFAREVLSRLASQGQPLVQHQNQGQPLVLMLDQSKLHERPQVLMLAVRSGDRAWPVLGRVAVTD